MPPRPGRRAPNASAPAPPWLIPAMTIVRAPRLVSRAIGASSSAGHSGNGLSRMRQCDQHISGRSTRYPASSIVAASRAVVPFGESVLPCIRTTPMVCAETGAAMLMTATRVSSLPVNRLMRNLPSVNHYRVSSETQLTHRCCTAAGEQRDMSCRGGLRFARLITTRPPGAGDKMTRGSTETGLPQATRFLLPWAVTFAGPASR